METRVTLVSGLFYIGRDRWKHSGFPPNYDRYKDWINNILSLNTNLILFVDEYYHDHVLELSKKYASDNKKLLLIKTSISELETYQKYYNKISCVMKSPSFVDFIKTNKVAEMCYPLYNVIMFNKISLIEKAKQNDPFNSTHYYWTDAGAFRDELLKYKNIEWPDNNNRIFFNDKIVFFSHFGNDYSITNQKSYFTSQTRVVHGGYFIVPENKIDFLKTEFYKVVDEILSEEYIGSDEKVFDLICKRNPDSVSMIKANWFEFYKLCSKKRKKISLITVTWSHNDTFDIENTSLYKSFKKFNPKKDFYHFHFNRNHYQQLESEFNTKFGQESEYLLYKIQMLLEKVKDIETDYFIFCDANDVVCLSNVDYLIDLFDLDNYIILGHEKNIWPSLEKQRSWPGYEEYRERDFKMDTYLNGGMFLSRKDKYIEMLQSLIDNVFSTNINNFHNDQGVYIYHYNKLMKPEMKLDYASIFALNTYLRSKDDFYEHENRLVCKETGVKPCFIHDNGWNYGSPRYHDHFNLSRIYS